MNKLKVGVLASGRGSNFKAIVQKVDSAEVKVLIVDNPDAKAIEIAKEFDVPYEVVDRKKFISKLSFEKEIINILESYKVELIALAGFMRILSSDFVERFKWKIMNIHPSLLPSFPGLNAQKQALDYGVRVSGCTVHFVDAGTDTGPIILQAVVPVLDDDNPETLASRILNEEHKIYPFAITLFAQNRLVIDGRKVKIKNI
ncbi:MAG TPA: phosphoribosylglycinamide formyltransferase [Thermodesulfobium narugense]|uniref:Phosphoribosylglycinamide formyltransferase n=1 Tax=Thermodesulfobium acidiphilum TaxID=1794699 RepID=A0A2R4VZS1_THEAF|nr:phosphoribosylglycinamide formyltransferase [Thermodesulfobium acidiphilum]AWB09964.1 phosphoribosylglycinamide formyltransferase-1 [Thermodesulfobium acidiphilum]PMP84627.1 MAG: phosphoribosylglycinamide formyltransferase [Thermodesulfobium narugense]HEM55180.1 phosphoribosylglycinamide formyltransferase [Thermodesulfobium narugense]